MTMGKKIRALREKEGLTQEQLAEKLGVSPQAVSKWENDQSCPDISILPELAKILGVSTDELLGKEETCEECECEVMDADDDDDDDKSFRITIDKGKIVFPIAVLVFGIELIINYVCKLNISWWTLLWTDALTAFGLSMLLSHVSAFSVGVTAIGLYFILHSFGVITFVPQWPIIVAALIVIWGLSMLIDTLTGHRRHAKKKSKYARSKETYSGSAENGYLRFSCSFTSKKAMGYTNIIKGGEITLSFGELSLDLTRCEKVAEGATLRVTASFGEITLYMPKTIAVVMDRNAAFGDVKIEGSPDPDAKYHLALNCTASFGEIRVIYS